MYGAGSPSGGIRRLGALGRRSPRVLLLSALTGLITGAGVALFDWFTRDELLSRIQRAPVGAQAAGPLVGLLLAAAILRWVGHRATPPTSDEYIRNFHERDRRLPLRAAPAKLLASVATLGLGTPLGYEGPCIYLGAVTGSAIQRRLSRWFSRQDIKVLLVAGAAAGVAAIFKAPATGALFALEVPYQEDLARRMLLPALIAAATGYVTFAALADTTPLLRLQGSPRFDLTDLGGAVVIGVVAGGGARAFAAMIRGAKKLSNRLNPAGRALLGGGVLAGLILAARALSDQPLAIGPGYVAVRWATDPTHQVGLVVGLLAIRTLEVGAAVVGGGVGGLFVPLVVEGALIGRLCGSAFGQPGGSLFPVIGIAAFLGAGYRVPLAAVMFVAETTGRPEFVVPGVIAAVAAQLLMGRSSVSPYQQAARAGHLERRFGLPLSDVVRTDIHTVPPDATLSELFAQHLVGRRQTSVPVVEGAGYLGTVRLEEVLDVARQDWGETAVSDVMRTDVPGAPLTWSLRQALAQMDESDVDELPVLSADGGFVGVVSSVDILRLDEILEQATEDRGDLGV